MLWLRRPGGSPAPARTVLPASTAAALALALALAAGGPRAPVAAAAPSPPTDPAPPPPDLSVAAVTFEQLYLGDTGPFPMCLLRVHLAVQNAGGPSGHTWKMRVEPTARAGAGTPWTAPPSHTQEKAYKTWGSLAAGQTYSATLALAAASKGGSCAHLQGKSYYVKAVADADDDIAESDEGDNAKVALIAIP
jgi:hypothetical protein